MENEKKMNVIVLGNSGSGKSTLINSVAGVNALSGVGESVTQKIDVFESDNWPIRFIDTKGYEYNLLEQYKTMYQVKKYTKTQLGKDNNLGIDAVWYCIDGTVRRTFKHNIELMNKTVKGWKNIPVFVVITKSYSEIDIPENINAVKEIFNKFKNVNLKEIIPVVAQEYQINDTTCVPQKGIDELCIKTLECIDEAKNISKENKYQMILNQKRLSAQGITGISASSAVVVGLAPIPSGISDAAILVPLEVALTKKIFKIYDIKYSEGLIDKIIGGTIITVVAKMIVQNIPLAGQIANGIVAGSVVFSLGESIIGVSELIYTGKIDPDDFDKIYEVIEEKMKNNAIIGSISTYFEKNKDKLGNKSANEIFNDILKITKKKKK